MHRRQKLLTTAFALIIAVVMLAAGSYAWITLSTAPEISNIAVNINTDEVVMVSLDGVDFKRNVDLSEVLTGKYAPLNPISTYDGKNWYLPEYYDSDISPNPENEKKSGTITGKFTRVDDIKSHSNMPMPSADAVMPEQPDRYRGEIVSYDRIDFPEAGESGRLEHYEAMLARYETELADYNTAQTTEKYLRILDAYKRVHGEYLALISEAYVIYTDIWLKTEVKSCDVKLSVPNPDAIQTEEELLYGSYVLYYRDSENEDGTIMRTYLTGGPETAVRVGFMTDNADTVNTQVSDAEDSTLDESTFRIYEPNADVRSAYQLLKRGQNPENTPGVGADKTTAFLKDSYYTTEGNVYSDGEYRQGSYLWSFPIMPDTDENEGIMVTKDMLKSRLMVQKQSYFGGRNAEFTGVVNSEQVAMGRFYANQDQLAQKSVITGSDEVTIAEASDVNVITLEKDKAKRVRIYLWLEGQDPDCWNDIATGSIELKLEFAGSNVKYE